MTPPINSDPFRIFVSHSHVDNGFVVRLVQDLRQALGGNETSVWYDVADGLHGGEAWWRKVIEEITARPVFLVVISPNSASSKWVNDEIDLAWQQKNSPAGKLIVPLLFKECAIRPDLSTRHIVSFLAPKDYDSAFAELLDALGLILHAAASSPNISAASSPTLDPTAMLVQLMTSQIQDAYATSDWLTVLDKAAFLSRRAPTALPPEIYRMQAHALLEADEPTPARVAVDAALALDPLDIPTLQLAATVRRKLGLNDEAIPLLQDALAISADPGQRLELLREYVDVLAEQGQWSTALRRFEEALRLAPDDAVLLNLKLRALVKLNREAEALALLRTLTDRSDAVVAWWLTRARLARSVSDDTVEVGVALDAAGRPCSC